MDTKLVICWIKQKWEPGGGATPRFSIWNGYNPSFRRYISLPSVTYVHFHELQPVTSLPTYPLRRLTRLWPSSCSIPMPSASGRVLGSTDASRLRSPLAFPDSQIHIIPRGRAERCHRPFPGSSCWGGLVHIIPRKWAS
jgi:hypothetical protein